MRCLDSWFFYCKLDDGSNTQIEEFSKCPPISSVTNPNEVRGNLFHVHLSGSLPGVFTIYSMTSKPMRPDWRVFVFAGRLTWRSLSGEDRKECLTLMREISVKK